VLAGGDHHCVDIFLRWLAQTSPCAFARLFAAHPTTRRPRILCSVFLEALSRADVADANRTLDECAEAGEFGALVFPRLRAAEEIASTLTVLARDSRWDLRRVEWKALKRDEDMPVGLHWRTADGNWSSAMGFAPLGWMPVTRRAPYVGIVVWPGGYANKIHQSKAEQAVGFIDGDHRIKEPGYTKAFKATKSEVRRVLGDPVEDPIVLRDAAFCLPKMLAENLLKAHRL
jgi:hypothetical protein